MTRALRLFADAFVIRWPERQEAPGPIPPAPKPPRHDMAPVYGGVSPIATGMPKMPPQGGSGVPRGA